MISQYISRKALPPRHASKVKCDPQRHRLYAMEREIIGMAIATRSSASALQAMLSWLCRLSAVKVPKLVLISKKEKTMGWSDEDKIELNVSFDGANFATLIHELAHHIVRKKFSDCASHGAEFVAIYRELLAVAKLLPRDCFDVLAKRYGVVIGDVK